EEPRESNLTLRAAEARVRAARAQRGVAASNWYPTVDANGSYERSKGSKNISGAGSGAPIGKEQDLWQAGFDADWEIDVFGGTRRAVESANASIQAAIADRND